MTGLRALAFAGIAVALAVAPVRPAVASPGDAGCNTTPGGRVVLESAAVDPDVFVWDSRNRLVDYAAGQWGNTRVIFSHTILAEPGTQALVVACIPAVAHPKFASGDEDAIRVKVMSGPYRGRYGWVLSSDIKGRAGTSSAAAAGAPTR